MDATKEQKMTFSRRFVWFVFIVFLFAFAAPSSGFAKTHVTLGQVNGTGVDDHQIATVEQLLYSEMVAHPDAEYDAENFDLEIAAEITRLQRSYILIVYGYGRDDTVRSEKAKLVNFDEIDVAVKRLVAAIIEGKSVAKTARRGEVLDEEQHEPSRVKSIQGWQFSLGGSYPLTDALQNDEIKPAFAMGYFFDLGQFFIELRGDFQIGYNDSSSSITSFTVGGDYFFHTARTFGTYAGLEFGFGAATDESFDDAAGFVGAFDVGIMFLRHADINIDLRLRTSVLMTKFNDELPITSALMVGLIF